MGDPLLCNHPVPLALPSITDFLTPSYLLVVILLKGRISPSLPFINHFFIYISKESLGYNFIQLYSVTIIMYFAQIAQIWPVGSPSS